MESSTIDMMIICSTRKTATKI